MRFGGSGDGYGRKITEEAGDAGDAPVVGKFADVESTQGNGAVGCDELPGVAEVLVVCVDRTRSSEGVTGELGLQRGCHLADFGSVRFRRGVGQSVDHRSPKPARACGIGSPGSVSFNPSRWISMVSARSGIGILLGSLVVSPLILSTEEKEIDYLSGSYSDRATSVGLSPA